MRLRSLSGRINHRTRGASCRSGGTIGFADGASDQGMVVNGRGPALRMSLSSFGFADPAAHPLYRGNGGGGWFGWPVAPELERLRFGWFKGWGQAARKAIFLQMQRVALDDVAFIPSGSHSAFTAMRADLRDRVNVFALFRNPQWA